MSGGQSMPRQRFVGFAKSHLRQWAQSEKPVANRAVKKRGIWFMSSSPGAGQNTKPAYCIIKTGTDLSF